MKISEMKNMLNAEVLCGEQYLDHEATNAFSSDMMSDVLAYADNQTVLITGLCNAQVIRTAEMLDIACIIFVRGKKPDEHMLSLAVGKDIVILSTMHKMFTTCGILFGAGLTGGGHIGR